jgi:hypothetical protein
VPSICCRHNKILASCSWTGLRVNMVAEGIIYQMMYMKRMQKSVRRRTTDWKDGKGREGKGKEDA